MVDEKTIRNFLGVNLRDAAERVDDREVLAAQNCYQASKGSWFNRFGAVIDQPGAAFPLASRISGLWRHPAANGDRFTLYHCVPNTAALPDNTTDLTLLEVQDGLGNLFGGGTPGVPLLVCYSWIGAGLEQTYNTKNRAGFGGLSFPLWAYQNTSHQSITFSALSGASLTSTLKVTIPAFPAGVRGANIFVARYAGAPPGSNSMTYMGTITTSGGSLLVREFVGPSNCANDYIGTQTAALGASAAISPASGLPANTEYGIVVTFVDPSGLETMAQQMLVTTGNTSLTRAIEITGPTSLPVSGGSFNVYAGIVTTDIHGRTTGTINQIAANVGVGWTYFLNANPSGGQLFYYNEQWFITPVSARYNAAFGTGLPQGNYYVGFAPVADPNVEEGLSAGTQAPTFIQNIQQISISGSANALFVPTTGVGKSPNGAQAVYVFVGTQDPLKHPMTCVGMLRLTGGGGGPVALEIGSIPSHNAQSCPYETAVDAVPPIFVNAVNSCDVGGFNTAIGLAVKARFGFMLASKNGGAIQEVFPSRSLIGAMYLFANSTVFAGDSVPGLIDIHNFTQAPRTQNDTYQYAAVDAGYSAPFAWQYPVFDPQFAQLLGLSYFSNGVDIPWQTDGYTLGQLGCVRVDPPLLQTFLPPIPRFIFAYNNGLVVAGAQAESQVYGSNANAPNNWATAGSGPLLRFVTIGDAQGSGVTASGLFTPMSTAPNGNTGSYILSFKKVGVWMIPTIPDPVASSLAGLLTGTQQPAPMIQASGRAGCVAYLSVVTTTSGTVFFGSDANFYLIRSVGEPSKVGTKVQNDLAHLVGNDALMQMCTATYHDNHYKFSYPSRTVGAVANPPYCDAEYWLDMRTEQGDPLIWVGPMVGRSVGKQVVLAADNDNLSRVCASGLFLQTFTADDISSLTDLDVNGNPVDIVCRILSKQYRMGTEAHLKRVLGANLDVYLDYGFTNNLLVEFFADQYYQQRNLALSSGGAVWDASDWDSSNWSDEEWFGIAALLGVNISGRVVQVQITHSNPSPFALAAVTLLSRTEKRRMVG